MVVEDFTWNLIELSTGVISKTGTCAWLSSGNPTEASKQRVNICMQCCVSFCHFIVDFSCKSLTNRSVTWPQFFAPILRKNPIPLVGRWHQPGDWGFP